MNKSLFLVLIFLISVPETSSSQSALDFNGGTDHVILNGTDFAPPWTMEVWISKNESDNYQHLLTSTDGNSGIRNEQYWGTRVGFTQTGVADYYFAYTLPVGQWVHMAVVNDSASTKLYIGGLLKGTVNASIDFPMQWISKPNAEASLKARIRDLRIWHAAFAQATIQAWKDLEVDSTHPDYASLEHYYKMNEGAGNIIHDAKGSLDGTIMGPKWYIPTDHDVGIVKRILPERSPDNYSSAEPVMIRIKNYGSQEIHDDFSISFSIGGNTSTVTVNAAQQPMQSNETRDIAFPPADMNQAGTYRLAFITALSGDQNPGNDTLVNDLISNSHPLGAVTGMQVDTTCYTFTCGTNKVRLMVYKPDMFRIWLGPNGIFTNPVGNQIVESYNFPGIPVTWSDETDHYRISTGELVIRVYKSPIRFALYEKDNLSRIWEERVPLDYGTRTFQYLEPAAGEYFYGGGMQNGYFSHRGNRITIGLKTDNWDDGAVPNPAPFYMSTAGYGVLRNTFSPGEYDFTTECSFSHDENRFDAFYFYSPDLKSILNRYTELTGRPFLPPRWGLELGDANCYNKGSQSTPDVITLVADKYREKDMPGGWILPNDGYGCGYVKLDSVANELRLRGFRTGLWTESGLASLPWEVGTAGVRVYKLDVAWVGSGYQQALGACRQAYTGIENNSDARGFVWSVCGWAGTQRYSTIWTGDQSGNWEYIRFHIPTLLGAGLSGFSNSSSDLDGIFGGSAKTYTRDLQWKTFIPESYAMSGWASKNRQPWVYGEPYTSINRDYLKLKMRLIPYLYSYCRQAYETGVPVVRALVLEYPDDPVTLGKNTQYEFLSGEWMLVAPVYQDAQERDSIYFPAGRWFDYRDSTTYNGPLTLNDYPIALSSIPVFIKAGAIIPMNPPMLYDGQRIADTLTLDVYPEGHSFFELYEDDGNTRQYRTGAFAKTLIDCQAPGSGEEGMVTLTIGPSQGDFDGKLAERAYWVMFHYRHRPQGASLNDVRLDSLISMETLLQAPKGYYFHPDSLGGIVFIKTPLLPTGLEQVIRLEAPGAVHGNDPEGYFRIHPNPTHGEITIDLQVKESVRIFIYDTLGREIMKRQVKKGEQSVVLDLKGNEPGTYTVKVSSAGHQVTRKVNLIR